MKTEHHPLRTHLLCAVPLLLSEMSATGGPTQEDWSEARRFAWELGARGDVLLYGGKGAGEFANRTAHAVAVLAHCPGGITLMGAHFEAAAQEVLPL